MAASKLSIFNGALTKWLGERKLASLSEARESRRILDDIWDDDFIASCLEAGEWNFAARSAALDYSTTTEPPFGYIRAFEKPEDWKRSITVAEDPYFRWPSRKYSDEAGFWFADVDILYVKYVSDDAAYGSDFSLWPASFTHWVEVHLAFLACERLTQSESKKLMLEKKDSRLFNKAISIDAMNDPVPSPPNGTWVNARLRGTVNRER